MGNFVMMPKMGMTMTEGVIVRWLVSEGDDIKKGDNIFEVETDKLSIEVDCLVTGRVLKLYYEAGATVPINTPVAYIGAEGERIPEPSEAAAAEADTPEAQTHEAPEKQEASQPDAAAYDYDLAVVGAGPGGYVAAIRAAQLGAKVAVIERSEVGGTCLNRGCIPTKALYHSATQYRNMLKCETFGLSASNMAFDWGKVMARKNNVVKKLKDGVNGLLKKNGIILIKGSAKVADGHTVVVDGKSVSAKYILLATGTKPARVLKDMDGIEVLTTDTALELKGLPARMAIVGGGVIGMEMAGILAAFSVDVTVIELMPTILPNVDMEVVKELSGLLLKQGVKIMTGVSVQSARREEGACVLQLSDGRTVICDQVLEAVGRSVVDDAFAHLGLKRDKKGFVTVSDADFKTSMDSIYAIGDITGRLQLAHVASEQGIAAVENMFEGKKASLHTVPSCIFTYPEIATVGLTEEQAKAQDIPYKTSKFPFMANGKALTTGETEGFVKVIADKRWGEILGVHIIGPEASNLIAEAVVAMDTECTVESFASVIHAHPTVAEAVKEALLGAGTGSIHF